MAKRNEIARFYKTANPKGTGLTTRVLIVYELKAHYKAEVWNSSFRGWREKQYKPLYSKLFSKDVSLDDIRNYFDFNSPNTYRAK